MPERFDAQLAHSALIEGEATILGDEALVQGYDVRFDEAKYSRSLRRYRESATSFYFTDRDDVFGALYGRFTYAFGASYLWELRKAQGLSALATAFETPPVSTYAVMALDPAQPHQRENDLAEDAVPVLPDLTLRATRHLGRFAYDAFIQVFRPDGVVFWPGLPPDASFVADTLSVFSADDDQVLAVWRIRFDDAGLVADFLDALTGEPGDSVLFRGEDTDLVILASEDPTLLDALPDALTFEAAGDDYLPEADAANPRRLACFEHTP